jgi:hypothetical protein
MGEWAALISLERLSAPGNESLDNMRPDFGIVNVADLAPSNE